MTEDRRGDCSVGAFGFIFISVLDCSLPFLYLDIV